MTASSPDERLAHLLRSLERARRETDRLVARLAAVGSADARRLARRLAECAGQAHGRRTGGGPQLRLDRPCREPVCPLCRLARRRRAYARSRAAFELLIGAHPDAQGAFLTMTIPRCEIDEVTSRYRDLREAQRRFKESSRTMLLGYVRRPEFTSGRLGIGLHVHLMAFHLPGRQSRSLDAAFREKWQRAVRGQHPGIDIRRLDATGTDLAITAAEAVAYIHKGYQPSRQENLTQLPATSTLFKGRLRLAISGAPVRRAFAEADARYRAQRSGLRDTTPTS